MPHGEDVKTTVEMPRDKKKIRKLYARTKVISRQKNACILGSFIFSESCKMKNENLCSIFIFF